jgi:hypothetical protein
VYQRWLGCAPALTLRRALGMRMDRTLPSIGFGHSFLIFAHSAAGSNGVWVVVICGGACPTAAFCSAAATCQCCWAVAWAYVSRLASAGGELLGQFSGIMPKPISAAFDSRAVSAPSMT